MEALTETFDELNLGCEKTLNKQFNEGGIFIEFLSLCAFRLVTSPSSLEYKKTNSIFIFARTDHHELQHLQIQRLQEKTRAQLTHYHPCHL